MKTCSEDNVIFYANRKPVHYQYQGKAKFSSFHTII